jgi:hypothetical protein
MGNIPERTMVQKLKMIYKPKSRGIAYVLLLQFTLLILALKLSSNAVHAQQFTGRGGSITDKQSGYAVDSFPIVVSGLPATINASFGISKICINITHTKVSDLKVELLSPDGTSIWLTNRNGGDNGQGYFNTCFRANGLSGYVNLAEFPFTGEYIPEGRMTFLNNGQNPNGTWYLLIQDLRSEHVGSLNSLTIGFEENPTPGAGNEPCRLDNGAPCKCPDGNRDCELLPDMVAFATPTKSNFKEYPHNDPNYPGQLRFAVSIGNIGDGPLEIMGNNNWFCGDTPVKDLSTICEDGTHARQHVLQRIYHKQGDSLVAKDLKAGSSYYEDLPGHNHYHIDNWVEFRLVSKKSNGKRRKLIAKGRKISFCLFDSGICNNADGICDVGGQIYGDKNLINYGLGNYIHCNTHSQSQGLSVGAYDTYGLFFEGQHLDLPKGLRAGTYHLEIEIDPEGMYREKDKSNNILSIPIQLNKQS